MGWIAPFRGTSTLAVIAGASFVFNLLYVRFACPLDLAPDEAHYWDWSRNLDWGYYSKGPLIAWLIHLSCSVFGNTPFGVRFPAVVCGTLLLLAMGVLAQRTSGSSKAGWLTMLFALCVPPFTAVTLLMTIDAPFLACWAWGAVFVWEAMRKQTLPWWLLAGLCVALGGLAKQTMLLFPLSVAILLLSSADRRQHLRKPGVWVFFALGTLGQVPMILWNATHDWVSFRHVLEMSGVERGGFRWFGPFAYFGEQFALLLGVWLIAWLWGCWKMMVFSSEGERRGVSPPVEKERTTGELTLRRSPHDTTFLIALSLPLWLVGLGISFFTKGQPNWPAAAYVTGFVLAVQVVLRVGKQDPAAHAARLACIGIGEPSGVSRRVLHLFPTINSARFALTSALALGLLLGVVTRWPQLIRPALAQIVKAPTTDVPCPVRQLDPTARLAGWQTVAKEVDRVRGEVEAEMGTSPQVAAMSWTIPGELGFYCSGHPRVYSFGPMITDRHSQYDLWRPNPIFDAQAFHGQAFVYVGIVPPPSGFERIEKRADVVHRENGVPLAAWGIWVCYGFRGFDPPADAAQTKPRY